MAKKKSNWFENWGSFLVIPFVFVVFLSVFLFMFFVINSHTSKLPDIDTSAYVGRYNFRTFDKHSTFSFDKLAFAELKASWNGTTEKALCFSGGVDKNGVVMINKVNNRATGDEDSVAISCDDSIAHSHSHPNSSWGSCQWSGLIRCGSGDAVVRKHSLLGDFSKFFVKNYVYNDSGVDEECDNRYYRELNESKLYKFMFLVCGYSGDRVLVADSQTMDRELDLTHQLLANETYLGDGIWYNYDGKDYFWRKGTPCSNPVICGS